MEWNVIVGYILKHTSYAECKVSRDERKILCTNGTALDSDMLIIYEN